MLGVWGVCSVCVCVAVYLPCSSPHQGSCLIWGQVHKVQGWNYAWQLITAAPHWSLSAPKERKLYVRPSTPECCASVATSNHLCLPSNSSYAPSKFPPCSCCGSPSHLSVIWFLIPCLTALWVLVHLYPPSRVRLFLSALKLSLRF